MEFPEVLTEEEMGRIVVASCLTSPRTEDELMEAVAWAREARVMSFMLEAILTGDLLLDRKDGEVAFRSPSEDEKRDLQARYIAISVSCTEDGNFRRPNDSP